MSTFRLYASDWVYVTQSNVYVNDRTSQKVSLKDSKDDTVHKYLFLKFEPVPEQYKYKKLEEAAYVNIYSSFTTEAPPPDGYNYFSINGNIIVEDAEFSKVVYNNMPAIGSGSYTFTGETYFGSDTQAWLRMWFYPWRYNYDTREYEPYTDELRAFLNNGLRVSEYIYRPLTSPFFAYTPASEKIPYVEFTYYVDVKSELQDISPTSGYVPKNGKANFSWHIAFKEGDGLCCAESIGQKSGTFRWRAKGSGTTNSISCGTIQHCEVPDGTFSTDEIEWQVEVVTDANQTLLSDWYTLSTVEVLSEAIPLSPVSTMVDGSASCTFSWEHNIATSTQQTAADLQYHTGDGSWTTLGHVSGASTQYTAPANTFASGSVFWRVRTYNTDGAAGDWSGAAEIIVVAAPPAPVVMVTSGSAPRVSISWQSTDQQAWEAVVAGISSGIVYGLAKGWRLPDYLPDGTYTAKVRVCNKYNLWSPWGSCSVQVSNAAGEAIVLTAADGVAVSLRWASSGYDAYYVLRDGRPIAKTTEQSYTDNFCSGRHTYAVRGVFTATGQYGLSNTVTAASTCDTVCISPVPNAKWLRLRYADTSDRRTSLNTSRTVNYQYLPGAEYPSAEISEWTSATMSVQCAFASPAESAELEALEGSLVCVKDRRGNCAIGVLEALDKQSSRFFDSFSFSIQRVNYVEEVTYD